MGAHVEHPERAILISYRNHAVNNAKIRSRVSILNHEKTLEWLYSIRRFGAKRTLKPTKHVLELLGNPQKRFKSIHVGGTNGKGSTSSFIASILKAGDYTVGLFTSPHLIKFNERICINGKQISDQDLTRILKEIKCLYKKMIDYPNPMYLHFFDIVTAAAFTYFAEKEVDFAVIEVGLGGRLDATNVIQPLVSVITNIGLEHTNILGETLVEIAIEKAGIIKANSILVTATSNHQVFDVFKERTNEIGTRIVHVGRDITYHRMSFNLSGQRFRANGIEIYPELFINLLGKHQVINAVTAIAVVESLRDHKIIIPKNGVIEGLRRAKWPARMEVVSYEPLIIIDSAKDAEATKVIKKTVQELLTYDRMIAVFAVSTDKKRGKMIHDISQIADHFILTTHEVMGRSTDPNILGEIVSKNGKTYEIIQDPEKALAHSLQISKPNDVILIIGSVYLAGRLRKILFK
jgi:dihydrofolate synthase/folylpolyglutamate synthase